MANGQLKESADDTPLQKLLKKGSPARKAKARDDGFEFDDENDVSDEDMKDVEAEAVLSTDDEDWLEQAVTELLDQGYTPEQVQDVLADIFDRAMKDADDTPETEEHDVNGDGDKDILETDTTGDGETDTAVVMADSPKEMKDALKAAKKDIEVDSTGNVEKKKGTTSDERCKQIANRDVRTEGGKESAATENARKIADLGSSSAGAPAMERGSSEGDHKKQQEQQERQGTTSDVACKVLADKAPEIIATAVSKGSGKQDGVDGDENANGGFDPDAPGAAGGLDIAGGISEGAGMAGDALMLVAPEVALPLKAVSKIAGNGLGKTLINGGIGSAVGAIVNSVSDARVKDFGGSAGGDGRTWRSTLAEMRY